MHYTMVSEILSYPLLHRSANTIVQWNRSASRRIHLRTESTQSREHTPAMQSQPDAHVGTSRQPSTGGAERQLRELGIVLGAPPEPFGAYVEAVPVGNLLFLSGMLPTEGREAKFVGRVGAELDVEAGREAARLAALNALAVARQHLGSLDRVRRVVRLGVSIATSGDVREHPKVADGASELLQEVFGKSRNPSRAVFGVASLPLGTPVELEIIFEIEPEE
jgi:enamine deaminase RidA (YjgF/YER057c/UK114 family)